MVKIVIDWSKLQSTSALQPTLLFSALQQHILFLQVNILLDVLNLARYHQLNAVRFISLKLQLFCSRIAKFRKRKMQIYYTFGIPPHFTGTQTCYLIELSEQLWE